MVSDLLHFREVTYDIFLLLDEDHDQKLRCTTLDQQGEWCQGDIDQEFWDLL